MTTAHADALSAYARAERDVLDRLASSYARKGYSFEIVPSSRGVELPDALGIVSADAVARKGDKTVLIKVLTPNNGPGKARVEEIGQRLRHHPNWRIQAAYLGTTDDPIVSPMAEDDIRSRLSEADRLRDQTPEAALLLYWSVLEALLRLHEPSLARRAKGPLFVADALDSYDFISPTEKDELVGLAQMRNAIAHGAQSAVPVRSELDLMSAVAHRMLAPGQLVAAE